MQIVKGFTHFLLEKMQGNNIMLIVNLALKSLKLMLYPNSEMLHPLFVTKMQSKVLIIFTPSEDESILS